MSVRYFALILGIVYLLVAIMGFIPGITQAPGADAPDLAVDTSYGYLLGLFPVNLLHNLVHLVIGLWGIVAYRDYDAARTFSRVVGVHSKSCDGG